MEQDVALALVQDKVEADPETTDTGEDLRVSVGAGVVAVTGAGVTVMVTGVDAVVPPAPVQLIE
jgi:hypothetical protein